MKRTVFGFGNCFRSNKRLFLSWSRPCSWQSLSPIHSGTWGLLHFSCVGFRTKSLNATSLQEPFGKKKNPLREREPRLICGNKIDIQNFYPDFLSFKDMRRNYEDSEIPNGPNLFVLAILWDYEKHLCSFRNNSKLSFLRKPSLCKFWILFLKKFNVDNIMRWHSEIILKWSEFEFFLVVSSRRILVILKWSEFEFFLVVSSRRILVILKWSEFEFFLVVSSRRILVILKWSEFEFFLVVSSRRILVILKWSEFEFFLVVSSRRILVILKWSEFEFFLVVSSRRILVILKWSEFEFFLVVSSRRILVILKWSEFEFFLVVSSRRILVILKWSEFEFFLVVSSRRILVILKWSEFEFFLVVSSRRILVILYEGLCVNSLILL